MCDKIFYLTPEFWNCCSVILDKIKKDDNKNFQKKSLYFESYPDSFKCLKEVKRKYFYEDYVLTIHRNIFTIEKNNKTILHIDHFRFLRLFHDNSTSFYSFSVNFKKTLLPFNFKNCEIRTNNICNVFIHKNYQCFYEKNKKKEIKGIIHESGYKTFNINPNLKYPDESFSMIECFGDGERIHDPEKIAESIINLSNNLKTMSEYFKEYKKVKNIKFPKEMTKFMKKMY